MLIKGEALIQTFTFGFSVHGERGAWTVTITSPDNTVTKDETTEPPMSPWFLKMLASVHENAVRRRGQPARPGAVT